MFAHLDRKELLLRLAIGAGLTVFIGLSYLWLGRIAIRPVIWLQPGPFETWIPVDLRVAPWVYFSFYLLLYASGLLVAKPTFRRLAVALLATSLVSNVFFLLLPSGVPRDGIDMENASAAYRWLVEIDAPRNAFPSEHASLAILCALAMGSERGRAAWQKRALWLWLAAIYWATVATRQHVVFDLITGAALGVAVWWLAGRYRRVMF